MTDTGVEGAVETVEEWLSMLDSVPVTACGVLRYPPICNTEVQAIRALYAAPPPTAPTAPDGEPFMWAAEWEGGCGRMFREAYRTEEDARREAEWIEGHAFPLFRHAASAPTVHEVARVLGPLMIGEAGQNETAARIIELFQGKA